MPVTKDSNTTELSKTFDAVMSALDVRKEATIVVGHSMGAIMASELSDTHLGTVLIGPVHPTPALGDIFNKRIEAVEKSKCSIFRKSPEELIQIMSQMASSFLPTPFPAQQQVPSQHRLRGPSYEP